MRSQYLDDFRPKRVLHSAYRHNLERHRNYCQALKAAGAKKKRKEGGKYQCPQCPSSYVRRDSLRRHREDEHGPPVVCMYCGEGKKKSMLPRHIKSCYRKWAEKDSQKDPESAVFSPEGEKDSEDDETEVKPEDDARNSEEDFLRF